MVRKSAYSPIPKRDWKRVAQLYEMDRTLAEVAEAFGTSVPFVREAILGAGGAIRPKGTRLKSKPPTPKAPKPAVKPKVVKSSGPIGCFDERVGCSPDRMGHQCRLCKDFVCVTHKKRNKAGLLVCRACFEEPTQLQRSEPLRKTGEL